MRFSLHALVVSIGALLAVPWASGWRDPAPQEAPALVTPASGTAPPSDATVLFDGSSLEGWARPDGQPASWKLVEGAMEVNGTGPVVSTEQFGDCQLHVEFRTPAVVTGEGQGRGNSGVYVFGRYEVQVLDSYQNETYSNGQCGAIYGIAPPLVNACRGPGEWQTYDIVFRAPKLDRSGVLIHPPIMTVFHNGVLIQDHVAVPQPTLAGTSKEHAPTGPLYLQDHGNPVRYRNIWVRRL